MRASTIRRRYPRPRTSDCVGAAGRYCVGGALLKYRGWFGPLSCYPSKIVLARVLASTNTKLSMPNAEMYASEIITYNDAGNFEKAWDVLDKALTYND